MSSICLKYISVAGYKNQQRTEYYFITSIQMFTSNVSAKV